MKQLDPHTFGDSPAAATLAKILSQPGYERYRAKASTKYRDFCETLWHLCKIKDISIRASILNLVKKDYLEKVDVLKLPEEVRSYLKNVIQKAYKIHITLCREIIVGTKAKEQRKRYVEKQIADWVKDKEDLMLKQRKRYLEKQIIDLTKEKEGLNNESRISSNNP